MGTVDVESNGSGDAAVGRAGSGEPQGAKEREEITQGDIYQILSNERRRHVLRLLQEGDREVYLRELAERVAAWENGESVEEVTTQERRRTETALRQFHLPKMAEAGFIHYDGRRKAARLAVPAATYADYLDPQSEPESGRRPWELLLTATGAVSLIVFALPRLVGESATGILASYPLLLGTLFLLIGAVGTARRMRSVAGSDE